MIPCMAVEREDILDFWLKAQNFRFLECELKLLTSNDLFIVSSEKSLVPR